MNDSRSDDPHPELPPQLSLPAVLLLSVPAVAIILLTIFGNLLVLFFKARVGRTNTTLLVWNLGLTDFLVGLFVLPLGAIYLINRRWTFGHLLCRVWVGADVTFCTCSVVTICIISVDRYLAVTRPLRYKSVVTKLKVVSAIILIWAFSLGILLATVRWESHPQTEQNQTCFVGDEIRYLAHSVVFAFFLPASVTLTLYWRIYSLARDRQKALDRGFIMILGHNMNFLTNTLSQTFASNPLMQTALRVHVGKHNGMVEHQRRVLRTHERIAKTLGVVSCSFLFCWLPFFTLYLFNYQCENCIPPLIIDIASWLGYCNSMLNPIIYSFTVKEFKRSALHALLPIWQFGHKWLPKLVCTPPDPKSAQRITRKRQQITTAAQQRKSKTTAGPMMTVAPTPMSAYYLELEQRKRKTPQHRAARNGAIASLMKSTNFSITQNALTSAAMKNKKYRERKSGGEMTTTMIGGREDAINENDGEEEENEEDKTKSKKEAKKNGLFLMTVNQRGGPRDRKRSMMVKGEQQQRNRGREQRRGSSLDDDVVKDGDELFGRNGMVTTTLLLAASESGAFGRMDGDDVPPAGRSASLSSLGSSSDLTSSQSKSVLMPCKLSLSVGKAPKKRHSVCDPSHVAEANGGPSALIGPEMSRKKERAIRAGHRRALFAVFKKNRKVEKDLETEGDGRCGSPPVSIGLWKRMRGRKRMMMMSGSNSQGSVTSGKRKPEKREEEDEKIRDEREEEKKVQIICTSNEITL